MKAARRGAALKFMSYRARYSKRPRRSIRAAMFSRTKRRGGSLFAATSRLLSPYAHTAAMRLMLCRLGWNRPRGRRTSGAPARLTGGDRLANGAPSFQRDQRAVSASVARRASMRRLGQIAIFDQRRGGVIALEQRQQVEDRAHLAV